jgi:dihydrofolate reductase
MYGHGPLGRALLDAGLLDELNVWIHPRFVPSGTLMFSEGVETRLEHVATDTLASGVVHVGFRPAGG